MSGKRRNYSFEYKLAAFNYLKFASVEKTAKEFKVDTKRIREWREAKNKLESLNATGDGKRKRLEGGGRKVHSEELERRLVQWIVSKREDRVRATGISKHDAS